MLCANDGMVNEMRYKYVLPKSENNVSLDVSVNGHLLNYYGTDTGVPFGTWEISFW